MNMSIYCTNLGLGEIEGMGERSQRTVDPYRIGSPDFGLAGERDGAAAYVRGPREEAEERSRGRSSARRARDRGRRRAGGDRRDDEAADGVSGEA